MGFKSVYRVLQDVFPQVDCRALKAVAIEHSKDADMAVEVVLVEIIPNLPEKALTVGSSRNSESSISFFEGGGETEQLESTMDNIVVNSNDHEQSTEVCIVSGIGGSLPGATEALDASDSAQLYTGTVKEPVNLESLATLSYLDANGKTTTDQPNSDSVKEPANLKSFATLSYHDANGATTTECTSRFLESFGDKNSLNNDGGSLDDDGQGCVKISCENVDAETLYVPVSNQLDAVGTNFVAAQELYPSSLKVASEKDAFVVEFGDSDDGSGMSPVLARSEEKCSIELLEEIIEDAKNSKKTLVVAMNSVVDLIREVESKEKAADIAKEDATHGCSDILAKADEVKQALLRAKEANDMHAGEVNAEKAILATELKELQLRLFTLSDERNRSLAILDEMRKALETRLAAALDEIAAAEQQKLENERAAREALVYQENQMEKVVAESKKLKLEAEENSKLQDFLMDRGRAIDILQGEISVKCQDVLLLKEKFDKRIPLSRSLSSSITSSILASSGSSLRSIGTRYEPEPEVETFESLMKSTEMGDSYGFVDKSSRSDVAPGGAVNLGGGDDHMMMLQEDGWDFLDK